MGLFNFIKKIRGNNDASIENKKQPKEYYGLNMINGIKPTKEQKDIIKALAKNKVLKINAFAGTGKTSTLQILTSYYATNKFLYLAYNKSIQLEAGSKFGKNVEVKTIHSLAYKYVSSHTDLNLKKIITYNAKNISEMFMVDYKKAKQILLAFNKYCHLDKVYIDSNNAHCYYVQSIIEKIEKKELDISFDYILKKFHLLLSKGIDIEHFDTVMLDEAQDSNDVTLDIFNKLNSKHKVLVGDKHQQIYSFRDSTNAMNKIKGVELTLTKTFRFPKSIASLSNILLQRFKDEQLIIHSDKNDIDFDTVYNDKNKTVGFISRGNGTLIGKMKELSIKNEKYKTIRHPKEIFLLMIDIGHFLDKNKNKISAQNNFLKNLKNKEDLEDYIFQTKDMQLGINLWNYESVFSSNLNTVLDLEKEAIKYFNSNEDFKFFLTTAHSSKGLEFDCILVADGFFTFDKIICKMGYKTYEDFIKEVRTKHSKMIDEFNLFYVALTRCKLSAKIEDSNMKYLLNDDWKSILDNNLMIANKQYGCNR